MLSGSLADGSPLQRTSTWTWITGDQHLSNFGAWMARDGKVVLGVNDFDEAAIYDFQIDVSRRRSLELSYLRYLTFSNFSFYLLRWRFSPGNSCPTTQLDG